MKAVIPLLLVLLLVPITNVTAQGTDPLSLLNAYVAAVNSGDVERATASYADDAVITTPRGTKITGKEAIRQWLQGGINAKTQLVVVNAHVVGDAVTWTIWERADFWVRLGIAPVETRNRFARGGKIASRTIYYAPKSLARIRRAWCTPQAKDVLIVGLSCSEYTQLAKAHTESLAVNLKPLSAETDYESLQNYLSPLRW